MLGRDRGGFWVRSGFRETIEVGSGTGEWWVLGQGGGAFWQPVDCGTGTGG